MDFPQKMTSGFNFDEAIAILNKTSAISGAHQADHQSHLGFCYGLAGKLGEGILATVESEEAVLGRVTEFKESERVLQDYFQELLKSEESEGEDFTDAPVSSMFYPVFDRFGSNHTLVALFSTLIFWHTFFEEVRRLLGIVCVKGNFSCCLPLLENIVSSCSCVIHTLSYFNNCRSCLPTQMELFASLKTLVAKASRTK